MFDQKNKSQYAETKTQGTASMTKKMLWII